MNKNELAAAVAERTGASKADANRAVEAAFGCIAEALQNGDEVRILGFGVFTVADRAAGTGRHPASGEPIRIPAARQVRFKPGQGLKDSLNV